MGWSGVVIVAAILAQTADEPRVAWVDADVVDVLDEPDDAAFSTGRLTRGRRVIIRREGPDGWIAIEPPDGAFSLVEESDLEEIADGRARVIARFAVVRPGRDGAKLPGPPRVTLKKGAYVRLLDRRPLVVRQEGRTRTYLAITPPRSEARFLRADALSGEPIAATPVRRDKLASSRGEEDGLAPDGQATQQPRIASIGPIDGAFATAEPDRPETGLSPDVAAQIDRIAARHRQILRQPLDRWDLTPVEKAYEAILRGRLEEADRKAVEDRLLRVRRQVAGAAAARKMDSLLKASRSRDAQVDVARRGVTQATTEAAREYDARGLLQTSSRLVDGRRVHALLGEDGRVIAYLTIPPGLIVAPLLSHRVGVRGEGHYEESLRTRLILVKDLERLERVRKDDPGR